MLALQAFRPRKSGPLRLAQFSGQSGFGLQSYQARPRPTSICAQPLHRLRQVCLIEKRVQAHLLKNLTQIRI
jgi:hypothetical protein